MNNDCGPLADGQTRHQLSVRMTTEGNTWQKVWQKAQPVPVARQRRLFDDTNEALKVLHYLETRNMSEIYALSVLPALHTAILKVIVSRKKLQINLCRTSSNLDCPCRISTAMRRWKICSAHTSSSCSTTCAASHVATALTNCPM